jgi:hypothetical protein
MAIDGQSQFTSFAGTERVRPPTEAADASARHAEMKEGERTTPVQRQVPNGFAIVRHQAVPGPHELASLRARLTLRQPMPVPKREQCKWAGDWPWHFRSQQGGRAQRTERP